MKKILEKTKDSPSIIFERGTISIVGLSFPEDPVFYDGPMLEIKKIKEEKKVKRLDFQITFMNPLTARFIADLFDLFKDEKELVIRWFYEDEISLEEGQEFEEIFLEKNFTFIERKQENKTFL